MSIPLAVRRRARWPALAIYPRAPCDLASREPIGSPPQRFAVIPAYCFTIPPAVRYCLPACELASARRSCLPVRSNQSVRIRTCLPYDLAGICRGIASVGNSPTIRGRLARHSRAILKRRIGERFVSVICKDKIPRLGMARAEIAELLAGMPPYTIENSADMG